MGRLRPRLPRECDKSVAREGVDFFGWARGSVVPPCVTTVTEAAFKPSRSLPRRGRFVSAGLVMLGDGSQMEGGIGWRVKWLDNPEGHDFWRQTIALVCLWTCTLAES